MASSFSRSRQALASAAEAGAAALHGMTANRETLKAVRRKLLDVVHSAGLGESLLRVAERRHRGDVCLALTGMAIVVTVTIALFWWRFG